MKIGKKSPVSKQNTLTSATQTTMKSQNKIVAELTVRITNLEKTVERLQSELIITKNVNNMNEVDDLQQYQRHQCIIILIDGLQTAPKRNNIASHSKT